MLKPSTDGLFSSEKIGQKKVLSRSELQIIPTDPSQALSNEQLLGGNAKTLNRQTLSYPSDCVVSR